MKKTFPVNINGRVFHIDEDAYNLLNTYLQQLRQTFPGDEGNEIVNDIEARIEEIFSEIMESGANVINIDNVNYVIEKMGRPSDLSETAEGAEEPTSQQTPPPFEGVRKKLYRNMQNKVFGGVLSGVACYFGWNTNVLRLLAAVLALFTYLWPLVIAYLIAWMVIPAATTPRQILEMHGTPVTLGNIGQTIIGNAAPNASDQSAGLLGVLGKVILIFFGFLAGIITIGVLIVFIKLVCGLILLGGWGNSELLTEFNICGGANPLLAAIGAICLALCIALPCIALVWATCAVVFKVKGMSKTLLISAAILEVILIIAATVLLSVASMQAFDNIALAVDNFALAAGFAATLPTV